MAKYRWQWALLSRFRITKKGWPYLDRVRLIQTPAVSLYLHRIYTPDVDDFPHDHPWWFASLVLSGRYTESIYPDPADLSDVQVRHRPRGSLRHLPRHRAHQITEINGTLRTLVLAGPHHQSWRFWTDHGPVDWHQVAGATAEP